MNAVNIMIVGVGGQGTLLTSRVLGKIALTGGYDVKLSEVHGMAQRGGSVVTFVRYGENVAEPDRYRILRMQSHFLHHRSRIILPGRYFL